MNRDLTNSNGRIEYLAERNAATKYLEIGVWAGETFFPVAIPLKVAVDPLFRFNPLEHQQAGVSFFQITSDDFFAKLDQRDEDIQEIFGKEKISFDLFFIDGLHTFEQSFKDFENSLRYAHEKTLWLIDDVIPSDAYSAIPDVSIANREREKAGLGVGPWHGDVYKTIFAIHDKYPEISYCTLLSGNPQTVLWRSEASRRTPIFSSFEEVCSLSYMDMLEMGRYLMPVRDAELAEYIFTSIDPIAAASGKTWKKFRANPYFCGPFRKATWRDDVLLALEKSILGRVWRKHQAEGCKGVYNALQKRCRHLLGMDKT